MIAANRCAARFLAGAGAPGPYIVHPGFRTDRLDEVRRFIDMHTPQMADSDPATLDGYRQVMRCLSLPEHELPLRAMVNRLLTRAELSTEPGAHMGMGLEHYTNCTSPLRKYVDFLVHLQIKALLHSAPADRVSPEVLAKLAERLADTRAAIQEAERWLSCKYLSRLAERGQTQFKGTVSHVTSSGFTVRLTENGLEGFVDLRKDQEKFSYDKWQASLTSTTRRFQMHQDVTLVYKGISDEQQYRVLFETPQDCGLKPPREAREKLAGDADPDQ